MHQQDPPLRAPGVSLHRFLPASNENTLLLSILKSIQNIQTY